MSGALQAVFTNLRAFSTPGWFGTFGSYALNQYQPVTGVNTDSSNNLYFVGNINSAATLVKVSQAGALVSQIKTTNTDWDIQPQSADGRFKPFIDASGNIFAQVRPSGGATYVKFNSSYVVQNVTGLRTTSGYAVQGSVSVGGINIDSSGNVLSPYTDSVNLGCCVVDYNSFANKYNSSGTVLWKKSINPLGQFIQGSALDSGQNLWLVAQGPNQLIKLASSNGAYTSAQSFSGSYKPFSIAIDSSDNMYIATGDSGTTAQFNLMKVNSSGAIVWARYLSSGSGARTGVPKSVIVGADGNIYMVGEMVMNTSGPVRYAVVVKYNSSGVLQWQRVIYNASPFNSNQNYTGLIDCAYTPTGLAIAGQIHKSTNNISPMSLIGFLPLDGSGTGSYSLVGSNITYAAGTFTEGADTVTLSSNPYSAVDSTTRATVAVTTAAATNTISLVTF